MGWLLKFKKTNKKTSMYFVAMKGKLDIETTNIWVFLYLTQKICLFLLQIKAFNMGVYGI